MKKIEYILGGIAFFLFFSSLFLYIFYRPDDILLFIWLQSLNFNYSSIRNIRVFNINSPYIIFSLPVGLFLLSNMIILNMMWKKSKMYYYYSFAIFIILMVHEILQKINVVYGTFDILDIATLISFYGIGLLLHKSLRTI